VLKPQAHPWGIKKINIRAHEFHYSSVVNGKKRYKYAFDIKRGYGINGKVDGLIYRNTIASFSHLRSTDAFNWVDYFIKFTEKVNGTKNI
jgi:cobyrinic acid a,c-diamide synthase